MHYYWKFGQISDGRVFYGYSFFNRIDNNDLGIPEHGPLPGWVKLIPFVIVADNTCATKPYIMKFALWPKSM